MSRLHLKNRTIETRNVNLGRIILFCEGKTEKFYFDYFSGIINNNTNKYNSVVVETQDAHGNAQAVLNFANIFLSIEENNREYSKYDKYLVFDCDAPDNVQEVIIEAWEQKYKLLISNPFFETWLLMHFENVEKQLTKSKTREHLSAHLSFPYKKARKGIIREILHNGDIEKAIEFSKCQNKNYDTLGYTCLSSINEMNPFSSLHSLVEELLVLIS